MVVKEIADGLGVADPLSSSSLACVSPSMFARVVVPGTVDGTVVMMVSASVPGKTARGVGGARVGCCSGRCWVCVGGGSVGWKVSMLGPRSRTLISLSLWWLGGRDGGRGGGRLGVAVAGAVVGVDGRSESGGEILIVGVWGVGDGILRVG